MVETLVITHSEVEAMLPRSRKCGDCKLCCTALEIAEIGKPMHAPCPLLAKSGKGCGVYGKHPASCQMWACTWRVSEELVPAEMRPDKVGWVMSWDPVTSPKLITVFLDRERPRAAETAESEAFFRRFADEHDVAIAVGGGAEATHIFTPKGPVLRRANCPEFFQGTQVGIPAFMYHDPYRSLL